MSFLSIARLKKLIHSHRSVYICTCPGDGLAGLPSQFSASLIPGFGSPDRPPLDGFCETLPPGAISVEVHKEGKAGQADRGHVRIESQVEPPSTQEGFRGFWVFVKDEILQNSSKDLYAFQLLSFECLDRATGSRDAKITGYQETGAHGILEVELPEGRQILVPLVLPHATVDLEKGIIEFSDLHSLDPDSGDRN